MPIHRKIIWFLVRLAGLRKWFAGDAELPSEDDFRNSFWRLTEYLKVKPEWSYYLVDIRLGFKRAGKWTSYIQWPPWNLKPVTRNFWNGIVTFNIYVTHAHVWGIPMLFPRFGLVIRPLRDWWFETGAGILFDRGEFGFKFVIMNWHREGSSDARDHEEGGV